MKNRLSPFLILSLALAIPALAQPADEPAPAPQAAPTRFSAEQLDKILGPIALYPDALIALILPASTVPSDVVLAARFLGEQGDQAQIDGQSWDDSVKALTHYPDVIKWMDQNLAWTKQLGDAFLGQPAEVMTAVQRLRGEAKAAGTLVNTPQQQVVEDDQAITIVPTQPDVIYVPSYDPDYVYESHSGFYNDPFVTFSVGYATGFWLGYDLDWRHRRVWTVDPRDRDRYWREHGDWRRPAFPGRPDYVRDSGRHPWRPLPSYPRPPRSSQTVVTRPDPFPHSPGGPAPRRRDENGPGPRDRNQTSGREARTNPNVRRETVEPAPVSRNQPMPPRQLATPQPQPSRSAPPEPPRVTVEPGPRGGPPRAVPERVDNPPVYTRGAPVPRSTTVAPQQTRSAPPPARTQPQRETTTDSSDRGKQNRR